MSECNIQFPYPWYEGTRTVPDNPPQYTTPIQDIGTVSIINEGQRVINEVIRVYKDKPVWAAIRKMIEQGIL